ncbi:long-chain-fatty-acid--CoA ligase 4 [Trichonephila inaurata madagascariensis]|uniref:long-chain-fatty-acid--CoA ligase n=1 Tax=Trichonephila inaurata madagascariensis TaxID=2747483 RepID=A0A8X6XLS9_9ARAC|nr:long-chain-fatty-acid--CoA ligase 4 [Trichonephila inaurata madagascariensis]
MTGTIVGKGKNSSTEQSIKSLSASEETKSSERTSKRLKDKESSSTMDLKTKVVLNLLKLIIFAYDVVSLPIYFLVMQPWRRWKWNRTIWAKQVRPDDPYSPCVRHVRSIVNPLENVKTMDELFRLAIVRHGSKRCVGTREVLSEADEYLKNGKVFKKVRLGDKYIWHSYIDINERIETLAKGLLSYGLQPKKQIAIFAETRIEWMLACQACFRINVPVATLYATLGDEGIIHGLNETEVNHIITSQELLPKLKKILKQTPAVSKVVYMENIRPVDITGFPEKVQIMSFSELEKMGALCDPIAYDPPEPHSTAILMYTSGSTGTPKGVVLSHKNMVTTTAGLLDCIPKLRSDDVYIGYLPLAHSFEISAEAFFFVMGIPVGYSSPYTLTDKSTGIIGGCKGDATVLRPTIMTAVPLMADRIRKGVVEATKQKSKLAQEFFQFAIDYKLFWYRKGMNTPILNRLIFSKIRNMVGGRVRIMACGGAPLSPDTHDFIRMALDVQMLQAYGMTETAASATLMAMHDYSTGRVGAPLSKCYIKLVDWPEGNYHATDKPYPRGEIVIGGDCVSSGYFKNAELTNVSFKDEDDIRWFLTGDIGELYPDGTFKIIDRKNDLVKLQFGEYISLGKIEAELKTCPLVDNICVIGNGFHDYTIALIVPNLERMNALAKSLGKEDFPLSKLCQDPEVISAFSKAIVQQGQKSKLMRAEIPTKVKLVSEDWQPETGLVTAAFKIRRKYIQQFYKNCIDEMYSVDTSTNGTSKSA